MKAPLVPPGMVYKCSDPEYLGTLTIPTENYVIEKPKDYTPMTVRCYNGYEVYLLLNGEMAEEPITEETALVDGTEVFVRNLWGYVLAQVTRGKFGVTAETRDSIYPLDFGQDDRKCWTCASGINRRALEKLC